MDKVDYLLICLAEECGEVAQRCTKALRFGLDEIQPGQELTNRERLEYKLNDFTAIVGMLQSAGVNLNPLVPIKMGTKITKVRKYMQYAKELGRLDNSVEIDTYEVAHEDSGTR